MPALHVVETLDGQAYLGVVTFDGDHVRLHTGLRGRPAVLRRDDVESITSAEGHPDVEWDAATLSS